MNEIKNMTTKQKIIVVIGILVLLISDISIIGKILIILGIAAYFFMKNKLLTNTSIEYTEGIKFTLIIPIIQIIASFILYEEATNAIKSAGKIDNLHNISTYTPYLGDLGNGLDIANQMGVLSDMERSPTILEYINAAEMVNNVVGIGFIIIIVIALCELYGVFRPGKFTSKHMLMLYGGISVVFLVCSIFFGIYMEKFMAILSNFFSGTNEYPFTYIFPIMTFIIVIIFYKLYSKGLEILFSYQPPKITND